jgi:flagellar basal-body rod protein FlgF
MIKGIYTAARSLDQRIKNLDVIANNLANLNTTGYKREIPFSEVINSLGDTAIKKVTSQTQGELVQTSNPLDLGISGQGFFVLKNDSGNVQLTRNGRFQISDEGYLTDNNGAKVMGKNGPITLEETMLDSNAVITISKEGEIKLNDKIIDKILVVNVPSPSELEHLGNSNFGLGGQEAVPLSEDEFTVSQGYVEQANTNPIVEMEAMIQLNKEYESAQKVIAALDQSLSQANDIAKV